jgi:hypothetical protein
MLPDEFDANHLAAAPDDGAVAPLSGVARERQPEAGGQHDRLLGRDFRTGCGQILHDALTCREAAFERDPIRAGAAICAGLAALVLRPFQLLQRVSCKSGYRFLQTGYAAVVKVEQFLAVNLNPKGFGQVLSATGFKNR